MFTTLACTGWLIAQGWNYVDHIHTKTLTCFFKCLFLLPFFTHGALQKHHFCILFIGTWELLESREVPAQTLGGCVAVKWRGLLFCHLSVIALMSIMLITQYMCYFEPVFMSIWLNHFAVLIIWSTRQSSNAYWLPGCFYELWSNCRIAKSFEWINPKMCSWFMMNHDFGCITVKPSLTDDGCVDTLLGHRQGCQIGLTKRRLIRA